MGIFLRVWAAVGRIAAVLLSFTIAACVHTAKEPVCWRGKIDDLQGGFNFVTVCARDRQAKLTIYYPNTGLSYPTTCEQSGSVETNAGTEPSRIFSFSRGSCKNERRMEPVTLTCKQNTSGTLDCVHHDKYHIEFDP